MNILSKVTLANLRKNKTRTTVTIIGIILSAAMICAVTTSIASLLTYLQDNTKYDDGDWHGSAINVPYEIYRKISLSKETSSAVYMQQIGYSKIDSGNDYKPYIFVAGAGDGFYDTMPVHLISGSYPKNENEIILPTHLANDGEVFYSLGDTLTLEIGDRVNDGVTLWQNSAYVPPERGGEEERIDIKQTRTFTVVGFYERATFERYSAPGYTAITAADTGHTSDYTYGVYFKMNKPKEIYSFLEALRADGIYGETNSNLLMFYGVTRYENFYALLYGLSAIVTGLIVFGSVALIYNAFSISVSERTKQFGLLSSLGATKKQIRKTVLFEALAVSTVGIPLGILSGIGGIAVTLTLIGDKFASFTGYVIPMRICVSIPSVLGAVLLSLITVLISAYIPSKRATRVSAIEAIRSGNDIKPDKKQKTSKLTYRLFGLPGVLAAKHYRRNRKKYRATVMSLFMSIVLFVSASSFSSYLMEAVDTGFETAGYDITYSYSSDKAISHTELLEKIRGAEGVTNAACSANVHVYFDARKDQLSDDYLNITGDEESFKFNVNMCFISDDEYEKFLKENRLDSKLYMNKDSPVAVASDRTSAFDPVKEKFVTTDILRKGENDLTFEMYRQMEGYYIHYYSDTVMYINNNDINDYFEVPRDEAIIKINAKTGTKVSSDPYFVYQSPGLSLLYPMSLMESVLPDHKITEYSFTVMSGDHAKSYTAIKTLLTENGLGTNDLHDYAESVEQQRNLVNIMEVFAYGFIVLISLIAAANVFNTISTNISLRRREFAMLRSVGMENKGFNRMMNYECLLYGAKALLYGLPISGIITYFIFLAVSEEFTPDFKLPLIPMLIASLSVFAVVFVTMLYSMSKIKKDNPIDALKNENL